MSGKAGKPTPMPVDNRPGLSRVAVRRGTHSRFYESLVRGLADANRPGLAGLRTRGSRDFTLGLLDAWAGVCDTLTFYTERSANESYLRTATERGSLRAHARLIGYELAPAKAAAVHLAFTAEENNAPDETLAYEAGLQVRSIPRDGEKPQLFETTEPLTARASWNAMKPRLSYPQVLDSESDSLTLAPGGPRLSAGDPLLFLRGETPVAFTSAERPGFLRRVDSVAEKPDGTRVVALSATPVGALPYVFQALPVFAAWAPGTTLSTTTLQPAVHGMSWSISSLATTMALNPLSPAELATAIKALPPALAAAIEPALMQVSAGCFGNIAITKPSAPFDLADLETLSAGSVPTPGAITDTQGHVGDDAPPADHVYVYLEREFSGIVAGRAVLVRDAFREGWSTVHGVESISVEAYGLSAKVTRLELDASLSGAEGGVEASEFLTRRTTILAAPRRLTLADLPITADVGASDGAIGADQIELDGAELSLPPGKTVAITGERSDLAGVTASEIRTVADNRLNGGFSVLTFSQPPAHTYVRKTVRLNANVAEATHGETVHEVLGDGDAAKRFARYRLKSAPLTHLSAKTESGMAPALEVRVDGVAWDLVDDFRDAGPEDRVYLLRVAEDQSAEIVFGDGVTGQRPSTGLGNIEATYRKGAGLEGMLEAGQLNLLATKPAGLKGVTNPLPPAAAADAEALEQARRNAPLKVLTLGRVVSLRDYEDFARGFAAIAKARADWTFDGFSRPIYVTVAGQEGALLPEEGEDMTNLVDALGAAGEADVRVDVRNYVPARFHIAARLWVDPAYRSDDVRAAAAARLEAAFSFEARELGQGVSRAQVIAVLQGVAGVEGVDLDLLYRAGADQTLEERLVSAAARPDLEGAIPAPAELLTIDLAASTIEVAT